MFQLSYDHFHWLKFKYFQLYRVKVKMVITCLLTASPVLRRHCAVAWLKLNQSDHLNESDWHALYILICLTPPLVMAFSSTIPQTAGDRPYCPLWMHKYQSKHLIWNTTCRVQEIEYCADKLVFSVYKSKYANVNLTRYGNKLSFVRTAMQFRDCITVHKNWVAVFFLVRSS